MKNLVWIMVAIVFVVIVFVLLQIVNSGMHEKNAILPSTASPLTTTASTSIGPSSTTTIASTSIGPSSTTTIKQASNITNILNYTPLSITVPTTDPFNDPRGPYYHEVYVATSKDGLNFAPGRLLWDHASVPGAVFVDNVMLVYYVDGTGSSPSGITVARSTDLGKTWTKYALVLPEPIQSTCAPADPDPVYLGNGTIRLFLTCFTSIGGTSYIGTAASKDGITFTLDSSKKVLSPQGGRPYTDPDAIQADGQWGLYVSQGPVDIAYNSTDGINFTEIGIVSTTGAVSGSIALVNGTIRHYFCGNNGIESAISTTPSSDWRIEPGVRIPIGTNTTVCDPSPIILQNGTYMLFYKIQP